MGLIKKSFAQFRTIGKAAIVVSENRTSAPTTTGESAITSDVPTVTPIQYAGNTGKETTVDQTSCENAVQDLFECVQGQMHDPNSVCTEQQQAERIACTPSGNNSAVELVDNTAVQYAGNTGKEFTMNTLQIAYVEHLRDTMDYPFTTDMEVVMARRAGLMRAANSMSTAEILMDSTFTRKMIGYQVRNVVRMSRVVRFLRRETAPWLCSQNVALAIFARIGTPEFVKNHLWDRWGDYETFCAEMWLGGRYMGYETKAEALPDIRHMLELQNEVREIMVRLHMLPAEDIDYVEARMASLVAEVNREAAMTDERSFACTNPSIAQDYLTCKGEMTFTEAYGLCGELLDEAYVNGCCEAFADDCQRHERAFQQDAERYAEDQCDICMSIYSWEEDAASGSCLQECGGGAEQDLPDSTDEEFFLAETPVCMVCGQTGTIKMTPRDYAVWQLDPRLIQDKLSNISDDEREQLISGTHPACWNKLFQ